MSLQSGGTNVYGDEELLIRNCLKNVDSAYNDLITALGTNFENTFVADMSKNWACKNAQDFFAEVAETFNGIISEINETFPSVYNSINSAGRLWASTNGSQWVSAEFSAISKTLDVSAVVENINGIRGIDVAGANQVAENDLNVLITSVDAAITKFNSAVSNSGFIGGEQASSLSASIESISNTITTDIENLKVSLKNAINDTIKDYEDTAGRINQAFTVQ